MSSVVNLENEGDARQRTESVSPSACCATRSDEQLLRAVVNANQQLLTADQLRTAVPEVLAFLGEATQADRAYVYEHEHDSETGEVSLIWRFGWRQLGSDRPTNHWHGLTYAQAGLTRWLSAFIRKAAIHGTAQQFPVAEQAVLHRHQVRSLLWMPVFAEQQLWGYLGFETHTCDRNWTDAERAIVQAAADSLGGAIARHHHLEALRKSELRLQKLANTLPGMLFQCDLLSDGHVTFAYLSEGCRTIFGLPTQAADEFHLVSLTHPHDRLLVRRTFLKSARALQRLELAWRILTVQGEVKWVQASAMPEALTGGVIRWHGVLLDISDRKTAETQLEFQEAFLRSIYDRVAHRIFTLQVDPDGRITYSGHNRAAEAATGWSRHSVKGLTPAELFGEEVGQTIEATCRDCIERDQPITREEHLTLNGREAWVLTTFNPLRDDIGHSHHIIGTSFDITPMKAAQAELCQQAQELQATLRALRRTQTQLIQSEKMSSLGQLVAGMAHEINNPVNFIYGNLSHARSYTEDLLDLLQQYQRYYPDPPEDLQAAMDAIDLAFVREDLPKLLHSMKVGAERIQGIVSSLRLFSRTDEADMKAVNLHDGLESTLVILQNRLKARGDRPAIEVVRQYGALPKIECYVGQLNQVFMHLLSNAIDALESRELRSPLLTADVLNLSSG